MGSPEVRQTVIGDHNIFTGTGEIRINYHLPAAEAEERRILLQLAGSVKHFWIETVLEHSLHEAATLELCKEPLSAAVRHPWERVLEVPGQSRQSLAGEKKIGEVFFETGCCLLILGEPGAGKTVTLLELARDLIGRFETDPTQPVPVVLNLSTWQDKRRSLANWIEAELKSKYFVPPWRSRAWLASSRLLLLLDGLDEVPARSRASCVHAINEFLQNSGAPGIVVCSRRTEYTALPERLSFKGAVCLQPLTMDQIDAYLQGGGNRLAGVRQVIREDRPLQELAHSPLMLNVISLAYQDLSAETIADQSAKNVESRRMHLFECYVKRMFQRAGKGHDTYPQERTISWLSWLGREMRQHSETVFLIEHLQPSWLKTPTQQWGYAISSRVFVALSWMVLWWILTLALQPVFRQVLLSGMVITVLTGAIAGILAGVTAGRRQTSMPRRRGKGAERLSVLAEIFIHPLVMGTVFGLLSGPFFEPVEQLIFSGVTPGPEALHSLPLGVLTGVRNGFVCGLIFGLKTACRTADHDIRLSGNLRFSFATVRKAVKWGGISGAVVGVILWVIVVIIQWPQLMKVSPVILIVILSATCPLTALLCGILFAFIAAMFGLFSPSDLPAKTRPGRGLILSAQNALLAGVAVTAIYGILAAMLTARGGDPNYPQGVAMTASALGVAAAVWYGGLDVIQHITLRFLLHRHGYIPKDYVGFLDYATRLIFLQKVGPGYIFVHRQLLDYFSGPEQPETELGREGLKSNFAKRHGEEKRRVQQQRELDIERPVKPEHRSKGQTGAASKRRRRAVVVAGITVAASILLALLVFEFYRLQSAVKNAIEVSNQGDALVAQGKLSEALDAYRRALAIGKRLADQYKSESGFQSNLADIYGKVGNVLEAQGKLPEALDLYKQSLATVKRLADQYKSNAGWQLDLSLSYEKVGNVLLAQGKLPEGLDVYQQSFNIHRTLAEQDKSNAGWQRNLSVSYEKIGNVLLAQRKLPEALDVYRQSLNIRQTLADQDKSNTGWQWDLSGIYGKVGGVLEVQGKLHESLDAYQQALAIAQLLASRDKANAAWQQGLAWICEKVGGVLETQGKLHEALDVYRKSLSIRRTLAGQKKSDSGFQWDLALCYGNVGNVFFAQGKLPEALDVYQQDLAIAKRLADQDKSILGWQQGLSWIYEKVGDVLKAQGELPDALDAYQQTLKIRQTPAEQDKSNAGWQRDLSVSYNKVGDVLLAQGKLPEALDAFLQSLAIAKRLAEQDKSNTGWQRDLSVSYDRVGDVLRSQGKFNEARDAYEEGLPIARKLVEQDPVNFIFLHALGVGWERIGYACQDRNDLEGAAEAYQHELEILGEVSGLLPEDVGLEADYAESKLDLAGVHRLLGRKESALQLLEQAKNTVVDLQKRAPLSNYQQQVLDRINKELSNVGPD